MTDGSGQYRIVDLRPGTYSVTFTLTGFNTFKREGVELDGALTATINADLRVGSLEETVTVTGESPIIDVQSVRRQTVISDDVMKDLPAARSYAGVMMLIPVDDHPGWCEPRHSGHAGHVGVRRRRRTQQRSAHPG